MLLIADDRTCYQELLADLRGADPIFLSRIGGSDTDAVVDYCRVKGSGPDAIAEHAKTFLPVVSGYNGFYDRSSSLQVYQNYCEELIRAYQQSRALLFCNYQLLSLYFREALHPQFYKETFDNKAAYQTFVESTFGTDPTPRCYPYQFIEKVVFDQHTLFRAFTAALAGKKVLVVSPFAESIAANFHRRHSFFKKDYVYPEFDLKLINTPITYAGLPTEMYPDADWFATLGQLRDQISATDFDIALLSCGSYAMPLGVHIERSLHRKAVYVGGVLQLYFGIMGRRYQNPFFLDQIHAENFIFPLERDRYLKYFTITDETAREAFAAYF